MRASRVKLTISKKKQTISSVGATFPNDHVM
jgi:hypothetical protein